MEPNAAPDLTFDGLLNTEPAAPSLPTSPEEMSSQINLDWQSLSETTKKGYANLKEIYDLGPEQVTNTLKQKDISYQNLPRDVQKQMFEDMEANPSEAELYRQQLEGQQSVPAWIQRTWFDTVSNLAPMGRSINAGAQGAVAGGGAVGLITGASTGNPIIGLIGAGSGAAVGGQLGAFNANFDMAYGPAYSMLIRKTDLPVEQARQLATGAATVSAILENVSLGIFRGMGMSALKQVVKSPEMLKWTVGAMRATAKNMGVEYVFGTGKDALTEAGQTLVAEQLIGVVAALMEGKDAWAYKKPKEIWDATTKAFVDALGPSAVLGGASMGAGAAAGATLNATANTATAVSNQMANQGSLLNAVLRVAQGKIVRQDDKGVKAPTLQENPDGSFSLTEASAEFTFDADGNIVLDDTAQAVQVGRVEETVDLSQGADVQTIADATGLPVDVVQQGADLLAKGAEALNILGQENPQDFVAPSQEEIAQAGLDALFPQDQQDAPQQAPDKRSLAKVMSGESDNYAMNLSNYTDTLYSETSVDGLGNFLANGETGPMGQSQMFFSNDPSLALGQGANQGVLVEMQAEGVVGQVNRGKPGLAPLAEQGIAEFKGRVENDPAQYVKSITFDLDKVDVQSKGWAANVYRSFLRAEEYTHETIGNKTKFTKAPQKQAPTGEPLFNSIEDVVVRPLAPVEQEARLNVLAQATKAIGVQVAKQEQAIDAQMIVNQQAQALKDNLKALQQEQKGNAAQIRQLKADMKAQQKAGKDTTNIGKTLAKIEARQDAVQGQINDAKLGLGELKPKPVKAMEEELQKWYARQDAAQFEADLIQVGLADPEEVRQQQGQLKINKIAKLIESASKSAAKATKQSRKATLREVRKIQQQLRVLVRESGLDDKTQKKILMSLKGNVTEDQMTKVFPQLHQQIMALQKEDAKTKMKERIDTLLEAKKPKAGVAPKGRTDADTAATLKTYRTLINDPEARQAVVDDYLDRVLPASLNSVDLTEAEISAHENQKPLSEQELETAQIALRLANFETFDETRLQQVAEEIADIITEGRTKARQIQEERAARAAELKAMANEEIDKAPGGDTWVVSESMQRTKGWLKGYNSSWNNLLDIISRKGKLKEALDELPARMAMDTGIAEVLQNITDIADATLKKNKKKGDIISLSVEGAGSITKKPSIELPGLEGKYNKNSVMHIYANMYAAETEPDVRAALESAGATFADTHGDQSTQTAVEQQLSDADKQVVENIVQYLTEVGYNRFNEVFRKENGIDLPKVQRYYPKKVTPATVKEEKIGDGPTNPSTITPVESKTRAKHKLPLATALDFFSVITQHVTNVEHYRAYAQWVKDTNTVFADSQIRKNIETQHGWGVRKAIDSFRTRIARNSRYDATLDIPGLDWYRGAKTIDAMGGKAIMFAKVASSGNLVTMNLSPSEWKAGVDGLINNWKATQDAILKNATLAKRMGGSATDDFRVATKSNAWTEFEKKRDIASLWMLPVAFGEQTVVAINGGILYNAELAKGRTPQEALMETVRMVESTQGSSAIAETTPVMAVNNLFRLINQFSGQQNQIRITIDSTLLEFNRALNDPKADKGKAVKVFLGKMANVQAATLIFSLIGTTVRGFNKPDDEPVEEFAKREAALAAIAQISSLWGGSFIVGTAMETALSWGIGALAGLDKKPMPKFPLWDSEAKVIAWFSLLGKYLSENVGGNAPLAPPIASTNDEESDETKLGMGLADFTGFFLRTPIDTVINEVSLAGKTLEAGDPVGAAFAAMGASKRDIKERAPKPLGAFIKPTPLDLTLQYANDMLEGIRTENTLVESGGEIPASSIPKELMFDAVEQAPPPAESSVTESLTDGTIGEIVTPNVTPSETPQQYEDLAP